MTGVISCTTYAFMPNQLSYCGPDKNRDLFEYGITQTVDQGLKDILSNFQTLWPYLRFIALNNNIEDAFDQRVVEAYWIGNDLLENTNMKKFYRHITDSLNLKKKLDPKSLEYLVGKIPLGAKPHHTFHVTNVFLRTGHRALKHTLETMDKCRISWGQVLEIHQEYLKVKTRKMIMADKKLKLSEPRTVEIIKSIKGSSFVNSVREKDWVSFHWGLACEILNKQQVKNLYRYTQEAIQLANLTI